MSCAAANASLQLLLSDNCQNQIRSITQSHILFADSLKSESFIKKIRQQGTIIAIELNTKEDSSYFNAIRNEIYEFSLAQGVLLRPLGNVIYIMPPYCIASDELEKVYAVIKNMIRILESK